MLHRRCCRNDFLAVSWGDGTDAANKEPGFSPLSAESASDLGGQSALPHLRRAGGSFSASEHLQRQQSRAQRFSAPPTLASSWSRGTPAGTTMPTECGPCSGRHTPTCASSANLQTPLQCGRRKHPLLREGPLAGACETWGPAAHGV